MDEICKTCANIIPSVECVNCGLKHRSYKKRRVDTTAFIQEFPCKVGTKVYYLYRGEIHRGQVLSFTIGHKVYANLTDDENGSFISIYLDEWDSVINYTKEEAEDRWVKF